MEPSRQVADRSTPVQRPEVDSVALEQNRERTARAGREVFAQLLEAQRLRQAVDDLKRFNEQSLQFLKEAWQYCDLAFDEPIKTDVSSDCRTHAGVAPSDAHEERVRQIRDLAEKSNDIAVRNILLSLADSYGCIEE